MKGRIKTVAQVFLIVWLIISLPVMAILAFNEYDRFILMETCVHWRGKFQPIDYVFIGDSITAGGRNWGWRLKHNPLAARNLGESGYMVWQIKNEAGAAISYHPKWIFVLAGTNDTFCRDGINQGTLDDYRDMLRLIKKAHAQAVVTLVPYQGWDQNEAVIKKFNVDLEQLCKEEGAIVVDLNPIIAPDDRLLSEYSKDGVHFTQKAYSVWQDKLRDVIATH